MSALAPTVSPELKSLMRRLRLGQLLDTLPERAVLARQHNLSHLEFLEQLFADEVQRRDASSAGVRARAARLDPTMVLEAWDSTAEVTYDKAIWSELVSLRFVEQARNAIILGPVGVGKTFLATALGHIACRRRISVHFERADRMLKRLKATRLDASYDAEMRRLVGVELLMIDDFALHALDPVETQDIYALVIERHHNAATVLTSNRDPSEMAGGDGRPATRPVGRRPAEERSVGAHHRGRVIPSTREASPRHATKDDPHHPPAHQTHLTPLPARREHRVRPELVSLEVVPCRWQRHGPIDLAGDTPGAASAHRQLLRLRRLELDPSPRQADGLSR